MARHDGRRITLGFWVGVIRRSDHFRVWRIERRQLLRSGAPVTLEPKAFDLLSLLLARRPRVLSKAQIRLIDESTAPYTYLFRYQLLGGRDALLQLEPYVA